MHSILLTIATLPHKKTIPADAQNELKWLNKKSKLKRSFDKQINSRGACARGRRSESRSHPVFVEYVFSYFRFPLFRARVTVYLFRACILFVFKLETVIVIFTEHCSL